MLTDQSDGQKSLNGDISLGLVVSDYYRDIAQGLLSGVMSVLDEHSEVRHEIVRVSGAWEIPLIGHVMAQSKRFQALIAIGCIIRGETSHFDHLCQQCARALMTLSMDYTIPVGFGVLTVDDHIQAQQRSSVEDLKKNKGCEAAVSVLRSIYAIDEIRRNY